jgi:hypothetical protein
MFHSRGNKQEIVRSKLPALTRANEITGAADNNIDFIAAMRYLGIVPARRLEFHGEGAVLEQRDGTFLLRFR